MGWNVTDDSDAEPETWTRVARLAELGVMTSSLLHELRQPLFVIKATAELTAISLPDARERMLKLITQVEHIESLLGHYGGLGREDDVALDIDVREPLVAAAEMFGNRARHGAVALELDLADQPLWARVRESSLRQIAINLVQNALDAVENQPERRVVIGARGVGERICFDVSDSGPGIEASVRDRLFEPFVTSKSADRGTGLGLHITRLLADEAGGSVEIGETALGGTRVVVWLPMVERG